jgi:hypothetical protein
MMTTMKNATINFATTNQLGDKEQQLQRTTMTKYALRRQTKITTMTNDNYQRK